MISPFALARQAILKLISRLIARSVMRSAYRAPGKQQTVHCALTALESSHSAFVKRVISIQLKAIF